MINLVLTYNIDNAGTRTDFVEAFEKVLTGMGMNKEVTNQSTYFGAYRTPQEFATNLFNAVSKLSWSNGDVVTIYYPKVSVSNGKNVPDIGRHAFKNNGDNLLNHMIFKQP